MIGDYALVNALLTAALRLVDPADAAAVLEVRTGRHAALFSLGRLDEADEEYRSIAELGPTALDRADATAVQVRSLSHRTRFAEAIELGLESLRECGIAVPAAGGFSAGLDDKFDRLYRWLDSTGPAEDLARPELSDPALLAASRLIDAVLPVAYFVADPADDRLAGAGSGADLDRARPEPSPGRLGRPCRLSRRPAARRLPGRVPGVAAHRGARRGPRVRARHVTGAIHGRHDAPAGSSRSRHGVRAAHRARDGLIAGGELAYGGYTYQLSVPYSVDCAPSLAELPRRDRRRVRLPAPDRERADRPVARQLRSGSPRVLRSETLRRGERGGPARPVRRRPDRADLRASLPRHRRRRLR